MLLKSISTLLNRGHHVAVRFAMLLGEVFSVLDRPTLLQHFVPLSSLATLSLDYRRAFGDDQSHSASVDTAVSEAVVHFCLKLTENELRGFLARLAEWRDQRVHSDAANNDEDGKEQGTDSAATLFSPSTNQVDESKASRAWRKYSRGVSYYALIAALSSKLRSIFTPSMGLIWPNAAQVLTLLATKSAEFSDDHVKFLSQERLSLSGAEKRIDSNSNSRSHDKSSSKKEKKRRRSEFDQSQGDDGSGVNGGELGYDMGDKSIRKAVYARRALTEQVLRAEYVLTCVRTACLHDNDGLVDEARYNTSFHLLDHRFSVS